MSKISMEFQKSLPVAADTDDEDDEQYDLIKPNPECSDPKPSVKSENIPETEKPITFPKPNACIPVVKIDPITTASVVSSENENVLIDLEPATIYNDEEQQQEQEQEPEQEQELIDDNDNEIYNQHEIYDIMEVEDQDQLDNTGEYDAEGDSEFIYVNFKATEDGEVEEEEARIDEEEEAEDDESTDPKYFNDQFYQQSKKSPVRKKNVKVPKDLIEKYAHTVDQNQHVCSKCVKVFSTRTNLIRHIQSHDGNKPYVCEVCSKGFTQSGSLKQHMYIHTGMIYNFLVYSNIISFSIFIR